MRANRKQPKTKGPNGKSQTISGGPRSSLGDLTYSKASQLEDGGLFDLNCFDQEFNQNHIRQESMMNTQKRLLDLKAEEIQRLEEERRLQEEREEFRELESYL